MNESDFGTVIVDCAVNLHQDLGPGFLETVFEVTLAHTLKARGLSVGIRGSPDEKWHHSHDHWHPLMISPCLCASVRNMIEQGGEPDGPGAGSGG
jgi:hypothetical protein